MHARAVIAALLALWALASCDGNEPADPNDTTAQEVEITAIDFQFGPSQLTLTAGRQVELTFVNEGEVAHSFTSENPALDVEAAAGATEQITFEAPEEGEFNWYCRFHPDQMTGIVTIDE